MSKKWLEIIVKWSKKRGTLYFCQNIAFNFRLSSYYSLIDTWFLDNKGSVEFRQLKWHSIFSFFLWKFQSWKFYKNLWRFFEIKFSLWAVTKFKELYTSNSYRKRTLGRMFKKIIKDERKDNQKKKKCSNNSKLCKYLFI